MNNNGFAQQSAGISPALLNAFQNPHQQQQKPFPGTLNPSQLINGAGPIQQLGGSINPAALQQQQQQSSHNLSHLLNTFGISRDHFQALSQQERQNMGQKYIQMVNLQQNQPQMMQPQVGQQVPYERPSSSASNHGPHQNSMFPPPPPRPPTAQGAPQISRPGTSLSHRSPTIPGSGPSSLGAMMERPQSGLAHPDGLFKQGQNQSSQSSQQTPFPGSSNLNSQQAGIGIAGMPNMGMAGINNMNMGSMMMNNMGGIGVPSSPRIGGSSTVSGAMGPPGLPRSVSSDGMGMNMNMNMNGPGMNMMGGMNMNMGLGNIGGTGNLGGVNIGMNGPIPRPLSSMGMSGGVGGMGLPGGLGHNASGMGMNMMMGMNVDSPSRSMSTSQGIGGQTLGGPPQTPMRQGSLPPQTPSTSQQQQQSHSGMGSISLSTLGGMQSIRQNAVTPATGNLSSNLAGGPGQPGPLSRRQSVPPSGMVANINSGVGIGNVGIGTNAGGTSNIAPTPSSPMAIADTLAGGSTGIGTPTHHHTPSHPSLTGMPNLMSTTNAASGITNPASPSPASGSGSIVSPSATVSGSTSAQPMNMTNHSHLPSLNPSTTHITNVPLLNSEQHIRPLSPSEIESVKKWMDVDRAYEARMRSMKGQMNEELRDIFKPALNVQGMPFVQPQGKWLSTSAPNWWERGGWGSTGSNWSRFRRPGREIFDVKYSGKRDAALRAGYKSSRKGVRREGFKLPRKIDPEEINKPEVLVPIRIEFDVDHRKMRETFIWNLNDPVVTPEIFAQSLVDDYNLNDYNLSSNYHHVITKSIQEQLNDFHGQAFTPPDNAHSASDNRNEAHEETRGTLNGALDESEGRWWAKWRKKVKREARRAVEEADALKGGRRRKPGFNKREGTKQNGALRKRRKTAAAEVKKEDRDNDTDMLADNEMDGEDDEWESDTVKESSDDEYDEWKPLSLEEIKVNEQNMHDDMRILIKLDIIVASIKLDDQFEWDLDNPMASPEEFAEIYAQELGLSGEFKTAIAHSIREQVHEVQKSILLIGHPSEGAAGDDELKQSFLPGLTSGARAVGEVSMFTPLLNYLSDGEVERTEKEKDKEMNKRRKRNTRGRRGVVLPDRDPIRTYRTPAIGFPLPDAATLALQNAVNAPTSKRAAAAAASLTIANIVTSENRDDNAPFMPQPTTTRLPMISAPSHAPSSQLLQQHQQKEKKGKGFFKAPPFPASVLRPRAHVTAPTPSTAADSSLLPPGVSLDKDGQDGQLLGQDSRFNRLISAKRAKELEREAKEKEFVDGQHPNYINGVWHCSNCGCPESIAVGRRKGPLGDKSQCGTCGKFWHRHRRPRPIEYNSDPNFHSGLKQKEADGLKTPANKKRGAAAALRASTAAAATPPSVAGVADISEPQTPLGRQNGESNKDKDNDDDRAVSPVSTVSSESEAPLAHKVKVNGNHQKASTPPTSTPLKSDLVAGNNTLSTGVEGKSGSTSVSGSTPVPASPSKTYPPQWLTSQMHLMQVKYPNDRFEVILRKVSASSTPEWRIKCLDCPGKLYTPGPLETLSNYEVHLKNRQHRQRVNDRLGTAVGASSGAPELATS